jgi:hypothetical protein
LAFPIHTHAEARELLTEDGRVTGALIRGKHEDMRVTARRGVAWCWRAADIRTTSSASARFRIRS